MKTMRHDLTMSERETGQIVDLEKGRYPVARLPTALVDRLRAEGVSKMKVCIDDAERCIVIRPVDVSEMNKKEGS